MLKAKERDYGAEILAHLAEHPADGITIRRELGLMSEEHEQGFLRAVRALEAADRIEWDGASISEGVWRLKGG